MQKALLDYERYSRIVLDAANKMHVSSRMPPTEKSKERTKRVPVLRYDNLFPA